MAIKPDPNLRVKILEWYKGMADKGNIRAQKVVNEIQ